VILYVVVGFVTLSAAVLHFVIGPRVLRRLSA
jgi:hypothetical protein